MPLSQDLSRDSFKNIRLIATDMDGTLTQNSKFTPALMQALVDLARADIQVVVVTGRSAGWVSGIVSYLPIAGAIAENGGLFYSTADAEPQLMVSLTNLTEHRQRLAEIFRCLQGKFPQLRESTDNRFRMTDWTFDVQGLSSTDLRLLENLCQEQGWSFTYSTVQCHIKLPQQDKARGFLQVLSNDFPDYSLEEIVTVGDSPNDESLFDDSYFPISVGVANIIHYRNRLIHQPAFITNGAEVDGFCEVVRTILGRS